MRSLISLLLGLSLLPLSTASADPSAQQLATQVQTLFKNRCYQCHGEPGKKVQGGFDFVLDLERLRANPDYVDLNDPAKSSIYQRVLNDEMPDDGTKLSPNQKATILSWIRKGALAPRVETSRFSTASYSYLVNAMAVDLKAIPKAKRPEIRYLSLAHMPAAGDSDQDLQIFRDALTKLANSLSFQEEIFPLQPIDDRKLIYRIDLSALGWDPKLWDELAEANPYKTFASDKLTLDLNEQVQTQFPSIRGDWFAFAASKPPFYHKFLNIPETDLAFEQLFGINVAEDIQRRLVLRAGFYKSGVSKNNRMIERHRTRFGACWKSYDFAEGTGTSDLFSRPLGPGNGPAQFQHAGGETICSLPNGLQAYQLYDAAHKRLDVAPTQIVQDSTRSDATIINGISCMSCHSVGMLRKADQIREYVEGNPTLFAQNDLAEILATYRSNDKLAVVFDEDQSRFVQAMQKAGVQDVSGRIEPIRYLVDRFEKDVDLKRAVAELGTDLTSLKAQASKSAELSGLISRLSAQGVSRDFFITVYQQMAGLLEAQVNAVSGGIVTNRLGMSFSVLSPGNFDMGSPEGTQAGLLADKDRGRDETLHRVTLTRAFEMQTTPVTQVQWLKVTGTESPSNFKGDNRPVESVSWWTSLVFANEVSKKEGLPECYQLALNQCSSGTSAQSGNLDCPLSALKIPSGSVYSCRGYRLPTEAEWEYAAREAGRKKTAYFYGDNDASRLRQFAWFLENSGNRTQDVGKREHLNALGLEMIGNVWQWVWDFKADYATAPAVNPEGPFDERSSRVIRGGSWNTDARFARSAQRNGFGPRNPSIGVGFRLVRTR